MGCAYHVLITQAIVFIRLIIILEANKTSVKKATTPQCQCGVASSSGFRSLRDKILQLDLKIVNGEIMKPHEHPHLALLMKWNNHKKKFIHVCGGTIINNKYVLTAAHCFGGTESEVSSVNSSNWQVGLGVHNKFSRKTGMFFSVLNITTHEKYKIHDSGGLDNDIALLRLNHTILYTDLIRPACLPTQGLSQSHNYSTGVVQGWGKTEKAFGSAQTRKASLQILSDEECRESNIAPTMGDPETKICAEDITSDACQGDSGGPLFVVKDHLKTIVMGIISGGKDCGDPFYPGIYTKVDKYLSWIKEHTKDAEYCD